jgi:hypothetical protein
VISLVSPDAPSYPRIASRARSAGSRVPRHEQAARLTSGSFDSSPTASVDQADVVTPGQASRRSHRAAPAPQTASRRHRCPPRSTASDGPRWAARMNTTGKWRPRRASSLCSAGPPMHADPCPRCACLVERVRLQEASADANACALQPNARSSSGSGSRTDSSSSTTETSVFTPDRVSKPCSPDRPTT